MTSHAKKTEDKEAKNQDVDQAVEHHNNKKTKPLKDEDKAAFEALKKQQEAHYAAERS